MRTLREVFSRITSDGEIRHKIRQFNLAQNCDGKARSVRDFAVKLGFDVLQCTLPKGVVGRLDRDPFSDNGFRIEVNKTLSIESQRWAVLHEIGHWLLHVRHDDCFSETKFLDRSGYTFYVEPSEEREANEFAATLLFGDGVLEAAVSLHGKNLKILAKAFGVTEKTIQIALTQFCERKG